MNQSLNTPQIFSLLSIGKRGVGKTVFLAGSYAELHSNTPNHNSHNFWFECQDSEVQENMEKILSHIARTHFYPPATIKITSFNFNLKRHTLWGVKTLCQFRWWDIPGEICDIRNPDFQEMVLASHGCCVFINAHALISEPEYVNTLEEIFHQVVAIASLISQHRLKYAFALILTKCDLLEPGTVTQLKIEQSLQPLISRLDAVQANYQKLCEEICTALTQNQFIHFFVSNEYPHLITQSLIPNLLQHNITGRGSQQAIFSSRKLVVVSYVTGASLFFIILVYTFYIFSILSPTKIFPQIPLVTPQQQKTGTTSKIIPSSVLTGHTDSVWSIILSNDNQNLVSGSADKTIKIWNLNTGKVQYTLTGHSGVIRSLVFSSDRQNLISAGGNGKVHIWNWQTKQLIKILDICSVPLWSIAMSSDNRTLISGNEDGNLIFSDIHTGKILRVIKGHSGRIFSVAISPDGKKLVTGGIDKTIKIWELPTSKLLQTLNGHSDAVRSVTFSPNGQQIASGSWDNTIKIWNSQTGELLQNLQGHTARVISVTFSTDGKRIISGSIDNIVKVWNIRAGQLLYNFSSHSNWILGVVTSPDKIFSASKDTTIRIWTMPQ